MSDQDWNGLPARTGWHWLVRKRDGEARMAFYDRKGAWRVADAIGRTVCLSEFKVGSLYQYGQAVPCLAGQTDEGIGQ